MTTQKPKIDLKQLREMLGNADTVSFEKTKFEHGEPYEEPVGAISKATILTLLDALQDATAALEDACDTIHGEFCSQEHHPLCLRPRIALDKLRAAGIVGE